MTKGEEYTTRIQQKVWSSFVELFEEFAKEKDIDYHLLNKAAAGAFVDCANKVAVDEGIHEDIMAAAVRHSHRETLKHAPKFG